jgi:dimethylargininase
VIHSGISYRFSKAIARAPARSVVQGLRAVNHGSPSFDVFQAEHMAYLSALQQAGLDVRTLDTLEEYPDSVFIEDAALCLPQGAITLQPGAPSRTGESAVLGPELSRLGMEVHPFDSEGFVDGGDILVTDAAILVGLSSRTNRAGYEWLKSFLAGWGYAVEAVHTPDHVLHFKSDCCVLDSDTIMATSRLSDADCFEPFRVLVVPQGEEAAANSVRINDVVLIPAGFPATADMLNDAGYSLITVPVTQAALLDGGLSCMSLRLSGVLGD